MIEKRIEWIKDNPDYSISADKINITIPITRSFESEGKKYIYGYAAIFDSPDALGTIISKELVESSLPNLYKFPTLRFMHRTPLGQIIFDKEINGVRTFIDEHGFHILARIYDECQKEWNMIRSGKWGFSYGMLPDKEGGIGRKCDLEGKCYEVFLKGRLYEISVVDTPAHSETTVHVVNRSIQNIKKPEQKKFGFLGMLESVRRSVDRSAQTKFPLNLEEERRKHILPLKCTPLCPFFRHCPYGNESNIGQPCQSRFENFENEAWFKEFQKKIAPPNLNEQLLR